MIRRQGSPSYKVSPNPKFRACAAALDHLPISSIAVGRVAGHPTVLAGSEVKVTIEIEAPENTVRTVTENSRTLKFDTQGFERG
jgi:hypothetical protein